MKNANKCVCIDSNILYMHIFKSTPLGFQVNGRNDIHFNRIS